MLPLPIKYILKIFSVGLLLSACTIHIYLRGKDDGYSRVSKGSFTSFKKDSVIYYGDPIKGSINFMEITADELKSLISPRDKSWVVFWAYWCPHCEDQLSADLQIARKNNISIFFVSPNYNIKIQKKELQKAGFNGTAFIISSEMYGNAEADKMIRFRSELTGHTDSLFVVPNHNFFRDGKYIGQCNGGVSFSKFPNFFADDSTKKN